MTTTAASSFLQEADGFAERFSGPSVLSDRRREAKEAFGKMGIPSVKHEEWKYLNLSVLQTTGYRTVSPVAETKLNATDVKRFRLCGDDAYLCVVENGSFNAAASAISGLPAGIRIGTLSDLENDPRVQEHLFKLAPYTSEPMVALNTMLCYDTVIILADPGTKLETPIQLAFVAHADKNPIAIPARVLVLAGDEAELTIMESYHSYGEGASTFTNAVTESVIGNAARMHYAKVQVENANARHIGYHYTQLHRDSYQHLTTLTLGGSLVRNNLYLRLDGENINTYLNGLYVAGGEQVVDNHTLVDHATPHCFSSELYKGIIDDKAQGVFNGKIWVRQDAQKTNAYQSNKNILLSNDASMNTKPQLEIYADDVKCSHGATTGQLDEEALFYLRARGIGEAAARALLNHAFAADVVEQVENETIRQSLMLLLDVKLSR